MRPAMSLIVEQLSKEFPTRSGPLSVLRNVSLNLQRGEAVAITGPSGSGKSTLLHILGALDRPTSGSVKLEAETPFTLNDAELATFRNRRIGFVFQDHHLLPQCTVLENVLIPTLVNSDVNRTEAATFARALLERVGMSNRLEHRPAELSGGERQRVAVARSLILKPLLLLADEPTGNLDKANATVVGELLLQLHREQNTMLVVVTHSMDLANMMPKQWQMTDGSLNMQ